MRPVEKNKRRNVNLAQENKPAPKRTCVITLPKVVGYPSDFITQEAHARHGVEFGCTHQSGRGKRPDGTSSYCRRLVNFLRLPVATTRFTSYFDGSLVPKVVQKNWIIQQKSFFFAQKTEIRRFRGLFAIEYCIVRECSLL